MIEFGYDTTILDTVELLQSINETIFKIYAEEKKLRKFLKELQTKRAILNKRYEEILNKKE